MLSENIKTIREKKGIKQSEIARALGVEPTNYPRIEKRDKRLTVEMLEKIAGVLGVSALELLGYSSDQQPGVIKELEAKVVRLRTANKILKRKIKILVDIASLLRESANEMIDRENKRLEEEDDDDIDIEELKIQARELGLEVED